MLLTFNSTNYVFIYLIVIVSYVHYPFTYLLIFRQFQVPSVRPSIHICQSVTPSVRPSVTKDKQVPNSPGQSRDCANRITPLCLE
jgi:hypothetical protein